VPDPILILTGPPGVGKTTTARLLADGFERAVHLESDAFFHFIRSGYVEPWKPESHPQNTSVMRIVADAAAGYADAGYFTILDGIVSPRWFFESLHQALLEAGHTVAYAVLRAPLDVCAARAAARQASPIADVGPRERHAIDADGLSAERVAEEVTRRLCAGSLNV
jgi:tRNA uridine 5-carbamoylmethylation protein Kti12